MNTKLYLGLDVHKNSIVVASALADGSEPQSYAKWGGSNLSVERGLLKVRKKFDVEKSEIRSRAIPLQLFFSFLLLFFFDVAIRTRNSLDADADVGVPGGRSLCGRGGPRPSRIPS